MLILKNFQYDNFNINYIRLNYPKYLKIDSSSFFTYFIVFIHHYLNTNYYKKTYKVKISLLESQSTYQQMNPYLIFNILNRISSLFLLGKYF